MTSKINLNNGILEVGISESQIIFRDEKCMVTRTMFEKPIPIREGEELVIDVEKKIARVVPST